MEQYLTAADFRELLVCTHDVMLSRLDEQNPATEHLNSVPTVEARAMVLAARAYLADLPDDDSQLMRLAAHKLTLESYLEGVDNIPDDGYVPVEPEQMLSYLAQAFA